MSNKSNQELNAVSVDSEIDPFKDLRDLIKKTNGKIAMISFIKANGELRKMKCRIGVTKGINPDARICSNGTSNTKAHMKEYLSVYDMEKSGWRTVNLETMKSIKCGDIQYESED